MSTQPEGSARPRTSDVISSEVRAWAARLGLKQRHLAEILGVSQGQVSARLNGHIAWSIDEVDLLADAFSVGAQGSRPESCEGVSEAALTAVAGQIMADELQRQASNG